MQVTAAGSARSITVSIFYPHLSASDNCRVAVYPRGAERPIAVFAHPAPIAEGHVELGVDCSSADYTFNDLPAGEYDVYYHCRTSRGDGVEWSNVALGGLVPTAKAVPVSVGLITPPSATGAAGFLGGFGTSIQLPPS